MKNIIVFILCFLPIILFAEINILSKKNTSIGSCNGHIRIQAKAETDPFDVSFNRLEGGVLTELESLSGFRGRHLFSSLCAGQYVILLTNEYMCEFTLDAEINECGDLTIEGLENAIDPPSSCSANDGSIYFQTGGPMGGTPPYQITLSDENKNVMPRTTSGVWNNLASGKYVFQTLDANDCSDNIYFTMEGSNTPDLTIDVESSCAANSNGYISINAFDPTNNKTRYNFTWSNGHLSSNEWASELENLTAGIYFVTISDVDNICEVVREIEVPGIPQNGSLEVNGIAKNAVCQDQSGTIKLNIDGGKKPFTYLWNDNRNYGSRYSLLPGRYCVTATDYCGNSGAQCFEVLSDYQSMEVDGTVISRPEGSTINSFATGGDGIYSYDWSSGHYTPTVRGLTSGEYILTVYDASGCKAEKRFAVVECEEADPLELEVLRFEPPRDKRLNTGTDNGPCYGNETIKIDLIRGGTPPYYIDIRPDNPLPSNDFSHSFYLNEPYYWADHHPNDRLLFDAPKWRYIITVYDACGNKQTNILDNGCEYCGYYFEGDEFYIAEGGFRLDWSCLCTGSGHCDNKDVELRIEIDEARFSTGLTYTIIWPDLSETALSKPQKDVLISGVSSYNFGRGVDAHGEYEITVLRNDGCEIVIPITVENGHLAVFFETSHDQNDYYVATSGCEMCAPVAKGYYQQGEALCDNPTNSRKIFGYFPNDLNNPCTGGGTIRGYKYENGQVVLSSFSVPPYVNIPYPSRRLLGGLADEILEGKDCDRGAGHCLFDALDVYGFALNKPLLVTYCKQFEAEGRDSDGDGWTDDEDDCPYVYDITNICTPKEDKDGDGISNGDEDKYCVRLEEIEKDNGCDIWVYCIYSNGTREFLYAKDSDDIEACTFTTESGKCTVRAFCPSGCSYEVLNEVGYGTTYPDRVCDESLPTCDELFEECKNNIIGKKTMSTENQIHQFEIPEKIQAGTIMVFPNPFMSSIKVISSHIQFIKSSRIVLYNSLGKEILNEPIVATKDIVYTYNYIGGLSSLPAGLYTLVVRNDKELLAVKRIVKAAP